MDPTIESRRTWEALEFPAQLQADPTERRRLQNRIAQRKFRQRKQQALQSSNEAHSADNPAIPPPAPSRAEQSIASTSSSSSPQYRLASAHAPSFISLPPPPLSTPLNTPRSDEDGLGFDFGIDAIDQWLCEANSSSSSSLDDSYITAQWPSASDSCTTLQRSTGYPDPLLGDRSAAAAAGTTRNDGNNTAAPTPIHKGWMSTVHIAAQKGHDRIIRILLERGGIDANSADSDGRTPLFHASVEGHEPVVRVLLDHGAHLRRLDADGRSALHWAVLYRRLRILKTLLEHWREHEKDWFSINTYDNVGWTPLHLAVERGFEEGVLLLIQCGADINAKAKRCPETGKPIPFNIAQQMR